MDRHRDEAAGHEAPAVVGAPIAALDVAVTTGQWPTDVAAMFLIEPEQIVPLIAQWRAVLGTVSSGSDKPVVARVGGAPAGTAGTASAQRAAPEDMRGPAEPGYARVVREAMTASADLVGQVARLREFYDQAARDRDLIAAAASGGEPMSAEGLGILVDGQVESHPVLGRSLETVVGLASRAESLAGTHARGLLDVTEQVERLERACAAVKARLGESFMAARKAQWQAVQARLDATAAIHGRGEVPASWDTTARAAVADLAYASLTSHTAGRARHARDQVLLERLPHTLAALARGDISVGTVRVIYSQVRDLDADQQTGVDADLADLFDQPLAAARYEREAEAAALARDPEGCLARQVAAVTQRRVTTRRGADGLARVTLTVPVPDAAAVTAALDRCAEQARGDGRDSRGRQQVRADTAVEAITGTRACAHDPEPPLAQSQSGSEAGPEGEAGLDPEAGAEPKANLVPEPDAGPCEAGCDAGAERETSPAAESDASPEDEAGLDPDAGDERESDPAAESDASPDEAGLDPEAGAEPEAHPQPESDAADSASGSAARPEPPPQRCDRREPSAQEKRDSTAQAGAGSDVTTSPRTTPGAQATPGAQIGTRADSDAGVGRHRPSPDVDGGDASSTDAETAPDAALDTVTNSVTDTVTDADDEAAAPASAPASEAALPEVASRESATAASAGRVPVWAGRCPACHAFTPPRQRPPIELHLIITDHALFADPDDTSPTATTPASLDGHPIPPALARRLLADPDTQVAVRRLYLHPTSRQLVAMDSRRRTFDGILRTFITTRDQTCRAPYSAAPIRHIDHATPHRNQGATTAGNGSGLCESANYLKDMPGITATPVPDPETGDTHATPAMRWRMPSGREYTTRAPALIPRYSARPGDEWSSS